MSLVEKPKQYVLFTPDIQDARSIKKHAAPGGSMFFGYKPAVLFLLNVDKASKPIIKEVKKRTGNKNSPQVLDFYIDYRHLKTPRVISVTIRFTQGEKKLKLVRLLDKSIVDPSKKIMSYGAEVAPQQIPGKICYDVYVAYAYDRKGIDKIKGCTE